MLTIPVLELPHFDQTVNLDGTDYNLSFRYNQRAETYSLSISTVDGEELAKGQSLLCRWPLFLNYTAETRLPAGRLVVLSNTQDETPPKIGELGPGRRCELFYITAAEVAEIDVT